MKKSLFVSISVLLLTLCSCGDKKETYTITWLNYDGSVLEVDENVEEGIIPTYDGPTPTKADDAQYSYTWNNWSSPVKEATKDAIYIANFDYVLKKYKITWKNFDGTVLKTSDVFYGDIPVYDGPIPTKERSYTSIFTFKDWFPSVSSVTGEQTYTATYDNEDDLVNFNINYELNGGVNSLDNPNTYTFLDAVTFASPTKSGYEFLGWFNENNEKIESIGNGSFGDIQIEAKWSETKNLLTVTSSNNEKGTVSITAGTGYTNETISVVATPKENCVFTGWYNQTIRVSDELNYTFTMPTNDLSLVAHFYTNEDLDIKYARKPILSLDKKTVTYGLYPQSNVDDETTIKALNSLDTPEENGWYFYNDDYYIEAIAEPYFSNYKFNNGTDVKEGKLYWFKCEPIVWNVLKTDNDEYLLMSDSLLDLQIYYEDSESRAINDKVVYASNYKFSDLREWLNCEFYTSAFCFGNEFILDTEIDNSATTTAHPNNNPYCCEDTLDKVFALSYQDFLNESYSFNSIFNEKCEARMAKVSDYAKAKGAFASRVPDYAGNGYYWVRSPHAGYKDHAWIVDYDGMIYAGYAINQPAASVRPCISINIEK